MNRAILESALDCIITMDAEGIVQEWNPAAERTFGYSRADAIGRELAGLIVPPELRERHRKGLAHYLSTGEGPVLDRRIEITGLHADGRRLLVELAITAIRLAGVPVFTAYLRDITDRVRAERRRDAQYAIASLLAAARSIEEVGPAVIETIAQSGNWIYRARKAPVLATVRPSSSTCLRPERIGSPESSDEDGSSRWLTARSRSSLARKNSSQK